MAFSKLKAQLRRIGARTFSDMVDALAEIRDLFTPEEGWNYFCDAGYASSQKPDALTAVSPGNTTRSGLRARAGERCVTRWSRRVRFHPVSSGLVPLSPA